MSRTWPIGAEVVAEFDVAADFGVVEVEGDAFLFEILLRRAVEGEAAGEVEVAADLGVDEIEAAEHAGREQVNVLGDLHAAGLNGGGAAVADVEFFKLGVADVEAVVEQAVVEREREGNVAAVEVELALDVDAAQPHAAARDELHRGRIGEEPDEPIGAELGAFFPGRGFFGVVSRVARRDAGRPICCRRRRRRIWRRFR